MFWHDFKYALKTLFRDKALIFWTFAFPLILATLFYMAFSGITESEKLKTIQVGVVDNQAWQMAQDYQAALKDGFEVQTGTTEELQELLHDGEIVGYLELGAAEPKLTFAVNGVDQTIFKYLVDEIMSTREIAGGLMKVGLKREQVMRLITEARANLQEVESGKLDCMMVKYYTLIAMTCLYGGILGMAAVNRKLANMSSEGKRIAVAPTRKSVVVLSSALASYVVQLIGLGLLFAYTILVLGVDYGEYVGLVVLLALVGCLAGLALGIFVTTWLKVSENTKTGIIIAVTMVGCFLAGMMGVQLKYYFDQYLPWLEAVNPASMITDGFYALYYYGTFGRYWRDLLGLGIFAVVLLTMSAAALRRQKYDNL